MEKYGDVIVIIGGIGYIDFATTTSKTYQCIHFLFIRTQLGFSLYINEDIVGFYISVNLEFGMQIE